MSTIKDIERRVRRIEGFAVRFLYLDGRDVRSDKTGLPPYRFKWAASNRITVETWKRNRFRKVYPGYEVEVLNRSGRAVQGNMRLATVRQSYER